MPLEGIPNGCSRCATKYARLNPYSRFFDVRNLSTTTPSERAAAISASRRCTYGLHYDGARIVSYIVTVLRVHEATCAPAAARSNGQMACYTQSITKHAYRVTTSSTAQKCRG
eukprot:6210618-Pleurochrysis_carterae.AAC.3